MFVKIASIIFTIYNINFYERKIDDAESNNFSISVST